MILQDARISEKITIALEHQMKRYSELCEGGSFRMEEEFLPDREDFATVYKVLRREFRGGRNAMEQGEILKLVNGAGEGKFINYVKLKYILRILNELNICEVQEISHDIYIFSVIFNASKTSIDKSSILKKLRGQCVDRVRSEQ
jgi:hypothetical protein